MTLLTHVRRLQQNQASDVLLLCLVEYNPRALNMQFCFFARKGRSETGRPHPATSGTPIQGEADSGLQELVCERGSRAGRHTSQRDAMLDAEHPKRPRPAAGGHVGASQVGGESISRGDADADVGERGDADDDRGDIAMYFAPKSPYTTGPPVSLPVSRKL